MQMGFVVIQEIHHVYCPNNQIRTTTMLRALRIYTGSLSNIQIDK